MLQWAHCAVQVAPKAHRCILRVTSSAGSIRHTSTEVLIKSNPLFVQSYPGSRLLELQNAENNNPINLDLLHSLTRKLDLYENNHTIGAVLIASSASEVFSGGVNTNQLEDRSQRQQVIKAVNTFASKLAKFPSPSIVVFGGAVEGTALSTFAGCKYRLATESTSFRISDLLPHSFFDDEGAITGAYDFVPEQSQRQQQLHRETYLPIGGGLAHHLVSSGPHGLAVARYLALSGRRLSGHDLYMLGLVTHIVQDRPQLVLADALGHTSPAEDRRKAVQTCPIDPVAIEQILDTMHIYLPDPNIPAEAEVDRQMGGVAAALSGVMDHPAWERMMLVPPQPIPLESFFEDSVEGRKQAEDFEDIIEEVSACFGADDSVTACRTRLERIANQQQRALEEGQKSSNWAVEACRSWESIDSPDLVEEWFKLTKLAATSKNVHSVFRAEEKLARDIE